MRQFNRLFMVFVLLLMIGSLPVQGQEVVAEMDHVDETVTGIFDDAGILAAFVVSIFAGGVAVGGGGVLYALSRLSTNTDALGAMERMAERLERSYPSEIYQLLAHGGRIAQEAGYVIEEVFDGKPLDQPAGDGLGSVGDRADLGSHPQMAESV